ncbi:MAG: hypothetical protein SF182_05750 [Deltaproteobacteria bacterium]|nr:hypothetical protein [Deltaproteobacteria bacterium]
MPQPTRGPWLTLCAVLFGILALSNLLKPLQLFGEQTGFVLFGQRLSGGANALAGPLFGIFLAVYAFAIWTMRRFAVPMSHAYAAYVALNLALWTVRGPQPTHWGFAIYAAVALGVSVGAAVSLTSRKTELA